MLKPVKCSCIFLIVLLMSGCAGTKMDIKPDLESRISKSGLDIDLDSNNAADVAFGGTNATTAAGARTNLGLAIGTDVQAYDADIPTVAASQAEMETGTEAALRSMSPLRVAQAIAALGGSGTFAALTDAFSLTGNGSKLVAVNSGGTALEPVSTISLDDSAAQFYDSSDDTKKILVEAGGLPTSTTAQMSPIEYIHVTVVKPQDLADAVRDMFVFWSNDSGKSFIIQGWKAWAGTDNTTLTIKTCTASGGSVTTVDAVEIATDGTSIYYASDTTITSATIANGNLLFLDFDDTDDPSYVKVTIYGYFAN